jgi:hypothetical protein
VLGGALAVGPGLVEAPRSTDALGPGLAGGLEPAAGSGA